MPTLGEFVGDCFEEGLSGQTKVRIVSIEKRDSTYDPSSSSTQKTGIDEARSPVRCLFPLLGIERSTRY
tara:strand:+ start:259 stop:465 length:207 start_codon:yes stop_codon:yes gene_type:complete